MSFQQSGFQPTTDQGFSQSGFQPTTDQDFSQTGFQPTTDQGFSQGGFQMTYEISLFDIKSLKSSLESTALQLAEAIKVLESIDLPIEEDVSFQPQSGRTFEQTGFQPQNHGFDPNNKEPVSQNRGFVPPDKTVELIETDAAAIKRTVGAAFATMDVANMIIGKPEFGPGFWQSGFREVPKST